MDHSLERKKGTGAKGKWTSCIYSVIHNRENDYRVVIKNIPKCYIGGPQFPQQFTTGHTQVLRLKNKQEILGLGSCRIHCYLNP